MRYDTLYSGGGVPDSDRLGTRSSSSTSCVERCWYQYECNTAHGVSTSHEPGTHSRCTLQGGSCVAAPSAFQGGGDPARSDGSVRKQAEDPWSQRPPCRASPYGISTYAAPLGSETARSVPAGGEPDAIEGSQALVYSLSCYSAHLKPPSLGHDA